MPVSTVIWSLSSSQAVRCGVALLVSWMLIGCATSSGQSAPPAWNAEVPRCLLAMSDGPAPVEPPSGPTVRGYNVPGRNPDSQMPWEFVLGNAAHRLIAYMYSVNHPQSEVHYNTKTLFDIVQRGKLGDPSRLLEDERELRPDIADVRRRHLFEIKPWNEKGLQEGRLEVRIYLDALNRAVLVGRAFVGGTDFRGEVLIRFARGEYIWRLEWQTTEPGVVQYRWTRSQQRFESEAAAYEAGQWVDITEQEMRQYGGWVGQAVEGMVNRRERLATFSGVVGVVIEVMGDAATGFFSGAIFGRMSSGPGVQQPPAQGGGQVIPFPARPGPTVPPKQVPAAAGMSLPR